MKFSPAALSHDCKCVCPTRSTFHLFAWFLREKPVMHNTVLCPMETIQHWLWVVHSAFAHKMCSLLGMWCTCFCTKGLREISSSCNKCFSDRLSNDQCDGNRVEQQCEFREAGELWKVGQVRREQHNFSTDLCHYDNRMFLQDISRIKIIAIVHVLLTSGHLRRSSCFLNVCHHCNTCRIYHTLTLLLLSILTIV